MGTGLAGLVCRPLYDVAIVGASIAGCATARLFAQAGRTVALIERHSDPEAYKVVCTHSILPSATPAIERLGLAPLLEARGAVRTRAAFWTPHGGWFGFPDDVPDGWGVTRRTLDPMLRGLAAATPGVELMTGGAATDLLFDAGRPAGVNVVTRAGQRLAVRARLVVGADGRETNVARLAGIRGRVRPHNRFFYFAYWRGVRPRTRHVRGWLMDPDGAAEFPNEDGLTVLASSAHRSRLPEFRADRERAYARVLATLPDAPDLAQAERVSKLIGKLEMPNVIRPAAIPGLALVGDATVATDPLFGTGCGWALQSAEWLADEAAPALEERSALDAGLGRYRRKVVRRLGPHHIQISDYASGRRTTPWERAAFRAATSDPAVARAIAEVLNRERSPLRLMDPRIIGRVVRRAS